MSSPAKTPSPSQPVPQNTPMAPPATPTTRGGTATKTSSSPPADDTVPSTPGSRDTPNGRATPLPSTPGRTTLASPRPARTPGGSLLSICKSDPALMTMVKVHTARCTECDKRNKDTMLRCPGCTFQICKPCRERREKQGRSLMHGNMMSPGGLGGDLGSGLVSGRKVTRRVLGQVGSPSPTPNERQNVDDEGEDEDVIMTTMQEKGKAKAKAVAKPANKKRATGKKSTLIVTEESSDDDFMPDPTSPTSNKRRRATLTITDTPTATSARPSRTAPASSTYIDPGSLSSSEEPIQAPAGHRPSDLNSAQVKQAWGLEPRNVAAPTGRVQELLEAQGVNTSSNRYENHFLARHEPVVTNRVISIPESVRRMADRTPRTSAVEKHEARTKAMLRERDVVAEQVKQATVRGVAESEAAKYRSENMHMDEFEELSSAIKEASRKWAMRTHDALPHALQTAVARSLDMRLDHIDAAYPAQLVKAIEQCAIRKLDEFAQDRVSTKSAEQRDGKGRSSLQGA